jgi:hypothetical protein
MRYQLPCKLMLEMSGFKISRDECKVIFCMRMSQKGYKRKPSVCLKKRLRVLYVLVLFINQDQIFELVIRLSVRPEDVIK